MLRHYSHRIGHVFYAVSILDVDVPAVRLGDIISLQPAQVVAVHENRHEISHGPRAERVTLLRSSSSPETSLSCASPSTFTVRSRPTRQHLWAL
jgi:hypothetical protein